MPCALDVELPPLKNVHEMFEAVLKYMYTGITTFDADALLEFFAMVHALRLEGSLLVRSFRTPKHLDPSFIAAELRCAITLDR